MISIIVPVYNTEKYLRQCLDSLYNQTLDDFEVIIVDDGSTDNSLEIIKEYAKKFKHYLYFSQKNQGVAVARNHAIEKSTGEYLMFLDADDYIDKETIAILSNKIKVTNPDMVLFGHFKIFENNIKTLEKFNYSMDEKKSYNNIEVLDMILNFEVKGYLCDKLYKSKVWKDNNIFIEKQKYTEDWLPIVKHTSNSSEITFVNKPLYFYRQHDNSAIHQKHINVIIDYNKSVKNIVNYINETNINIDESSMNNFKVLTFNETIHEFYDININKGFQLYRDFDEQNFNKLNLSVKMILSLNSLAAKRKLSIILWKLKIYHLLKKINSIFKIG